MGAVGVAWVVMTVSLWPSGFRPVSVSGAQGPLRTCAAGPGSCGARRPWSGPGWPVPGRSSDQTGEEWVLV